VVSVGDRDTLYRFYSFGCVGRFLWDTTLTPPE